MDNILKSLNVKFIKQLQGKTKKVYLVSKGRTKYILKTGVSENEKDLLTKEINVFEALATEQNIMPEIIDSGNFDDTHFLLQEYYNFSNLNELKEKKQLQNAYEKLADTILKMRSVTRETCGGFNIEKRFSNWKDYLSYKVNLYQNSILNIHKVSLPNNLFEKLKQNLLEIEEPASFQFLHMDLHGENIFLSDKGTARFIDLDEAIFGDKDYEVARILKAHFDTPETAYLLLPFMNRLDMRNYMSSKKALLYSDLRTLHYIEILAKESNLTEMHNQIATFSFSA